MPWKYYTLFAMLVCFLIQQKNVWQNMTECICWKNSCFFMIFMTLYGYELWLLEDAQTSQGEELCHQKHRCQVETTVLPVVAAVWNPPFGYLESERKFKVLVQMGFLVTKAEISACCMNLKGLLGCFYRKTKLRYWNRMCRFFSEVVTLFFGDNLASKRW